MPVSTEYWQQVRIQLEAVRPVTHRRMFGGIGLYLDGPVFGIVDNDRVFFKVDARTVDAYNAAGSEEWMYDPAVGPISKYRELPRWVLEDPAKLAEWIDASAGASQRLDEARKRRPKGKRPERG